MKHSSEVVRSSALGSKALDETSLRLRRLVLRALEGADKGHVGSALSLIEIVRVLYGDIAKHDPSRPTWPDRDRIILSKGHGCLALYAVLAEHGYFEHALLDTVCKRHSPLGGHPERQLELGIEASTGALGHGLPIGVGIALAHHKLRKSDVRVFVIVGDGELNEGSNWEAMLLAAKHQLSNLVVIVDNNGQQLHGPLEDVLPLEPLRDKFEAFGARTVETDGHNPNALLDAFRSVSFESTTPHVIICHTIKGKGLALAEQNPSWHYRRSFGSVGIKEISDQWAQSVPDADRS